MNAQLKPVEDWDLDFVRELPNNEPDWIDFKDSRWLSSRSECLDKISKYLSAWANNDGGYLVIGVNDPKDGQPLSIDEGVDLGMKNGVKDWLEMKLPTLVDEPLEKISVCAIPLAIGASRGVVVIHVPPSGIAPHQASDMKFYTRLGSHLSPLGKRAVLDILNRKKHPILRAEVEIILYNHDVEGHSALICHIYNESDTFCRHACVEVKLPLAYHTSELFFPDERSDTGPDGKSFWVVRLKNGINAPIYPRSDYLRSAKIELGVPLFDSDGMKLESIGPVLTTRIYADGAPPVNASFDFNSLVKVKEWKYPLSDPTPRPKVQR